MTTRCKMVISSIGKTWDSYNKRSLLQVKMYPVTDNTATANKQENRKFFASSPSGSFEVNCVNEQAFAGLQEGDAVYLDITLAEKRQEPGTDAGIIP